MNFGLGMETGLVFERMHGVAQVPCVSPIRPSTLWQTQKGQRWLKYGKLRVGKEGGTQDLQDISMIGVGHGLGVHC